MVKIKEDGTSMRDSIIEELVKQQREQLNVLKPSKTSKARASIKCAKEKLPPNKLTRIMKTFRHETIQTKRTNAEKTHKRERCRKSLKTPHMPVEKRVQSYCKRSLIELQRDHDYFTCYKRPQTITECASFGYQDVLSELRKCVLHGEWDLQVKLLTFFLGMTPKMRRTYDGPKMKYAFINMLNHPGITANVIDEFLQCYVGLETDEQRRAFKEKIMHFTNKNAVNDVMDNTEAPTDSFESNTDLFETSDENDDLKIDIVEHGAGKEESDYVDSTTAEMSSTSDVAVQAPKIETDYSECSSII